MAQRFGEIAYTAPGWSAHAVGSQQGGIALTIQDHPLQMAGEALIWQGDVGKASGYGRFGGQAGIDALTEVRWITGETQPGHFPL